MILSLDSIAVLDAIARRGSFAAAASELGKVPSALTYTVRRLEEELDVLLFDRRGKRARLTAAGEELLERGRLLMRSADDIVCRVKEVASGWEVELRIAVDGVVAFEQVRSLIEDFYRLGAPTRLRFSYEVLDGGWDALLSGRADLAIGVSSETPAAAFASGLYTVRPLGAVRFVYCVAPHHPLAGLPEPLEPEVLVRHRAVVVANSARALPLRSAGLVSGQDTLTVATLEQKVAMQLAGLGGGYLPEHFARAHLAAGRLVQRQTARRPEA
ncbi:MAG TPA: LysR substrate-binding domain-containing protein, partial [Burkholderiaceae bacterium]|nr:LysR substrate-binding domain-containing protein [Burkholderiaceae bacterium]